MLVNPSSLIRSEVWFTDGNIILVAGQFTFKVHRGQLQRHSEVFNDLFSVPQPRTSDDDELVEGCAYVELHDRPCDVFYFITALYDGLYFSPPSSSDIHALSAVLRLSTKYLVPHLRHLCLQRLHADFPSSLHAWDSRELAATLPHTGHYKPRDIYPHPVLVIQLALELGLLDILPAAFYDLARYGPSRVVSGTVVPIAFDELEYEGGDFGATVVKAPKKTERVVLLTRPELVQTLRGRELVQRYMANFIAQSMQNRTASPLCLFVGSGASQPMDVPATTTTTTTPTPSTTTTTTTLLSPLPLSPLTFPPPSPCLTTFHLITHSILRSISGIAYGRDADTLYTLFQALDLLERTSSVSSSGVGVGEGGSGSSGFVEEARMCVQCKKEFMRCVGRAREEVWRALPVWFGVVGGEDLDG